MASELIIYDPQCASLFLTDLRRIELINRRLQGRNAFLFRIWPLLLGAHNGRISQLIGLLQLVSLLPGQAQSQFQNVVVFALFQFYEVGAEELGLPELSKERRLEYAASIINVAVGRNSLRNVDVEHLVRAYGRFQPESQLEFDGIVDLLRDFILRVSREHV